MKKILLLMSLLGTTVPLVSADLTETTDEAANIQRFIEQETDNIRNQVLENICNRGSVYPLIKHLAHLYQITCYHQNKAPFYQAFEDFFFSYQSLLQGVLTPSMTYETERHYINKNVEIIFTEAIKTRIRTAGTLRTGYLQCSSYGDCIDRADKIFVFKLTTGIALGATTLTQLFL